MADAAKRKKSPILLAAIGAVLFVGLVYAFWVTSGAPAGGDVDPSGTETSGDRAGWRELHDELQGREGRDTVRPSTLPALTPPQERPQLAEPSEGDPESDDLEAEEDDALTDEELAERAEEIRRPLGGLGLDLIPPPDRPLAERAQATQELYNSGQDLAAREVALVLLEEDGNNEALIRIVVSTACMDGVADLARRHLSRLPAQEHRAMRMHCLRHGTVLDELSEAEDEAALDAFLAEKGDDWDPARPDPPPSAEDE